MANPFPFASGDVLTAAELNQIGELQTWTPTFNFSSLGNGTYTAEYIQINEFVFFNFLWTLGSTSTVSSGVRFGLPVRATTPNGYLNCFVMALDTSAAARHMGIAYLQESGDNARPAVYSAANPTLRVSSSFHGSYPFTWATGDQLYMTGSYRIA